MKWLKLALTLLPGILQGVIAVESAMKESPGAAKKQVILDAIQAGAKVGAQVPEDNVQTVSTLIDAVVGTLNASGVFTHTPASPASTTPPNP